MSAGGCFHGWVMLRGLVLARFSTLCNCSGGEWQGRFINNWWEYMLSVSGQGIQRGKDQFHGGEKNYRQWHNHKDTGLSTGLTWSSYTWQALGACHLSPRKNVMGSFAVSTLNYCSFSAFFQVHNSFKTLIPWWGPKKGSAEFQSFISRSSLLRL